MSLVWLRSDAIFLRSAWVNAEAVSKDYGGFADSKSKCLPVNFSGKSPCVLSLVAFCMGGWRCIRVRDTVLNAESVSKDYGG